MNNKGIYFLLISGLLLVSACKKEENASSRIDPNASEIAPASPDAVAPVAQPTPNTAANSTATPANPTTAQATANVTMPPAKTTSVSFNKTEHDFGDIKQGDKVNYTFTFKNTGSNDLTIASAQGSCGCTVPEYPKTPIKPGKTGKMKVTFDSAGKTGAQTKTVTIRANTASGIETLKIKANIKGGATTTTTTTLPVQAQPAPAATEEKKE